MVFESAIEIGRPAEAVFAFLRDLDRLPWHEHPVVPVYQKVTPGPTGVGTRYREVVKILPGIRLLIISEITRFEPDHHLAYRWAGSGMKGELDYFFELVPGGTRLIQYQTLELQGCFRLFAPLVKKAFTHKLAERLTQVKGVIEGEMPFAGKVKLSDMI